MCCFDCRTLHALCACKASGTIGTPSTEGRSLPCGDGPKETGVTRNIHLM